MEGAPKDVEDQEGEEEVEGEAQGGDDDDSMPELED